MFGLQWYKDTRSIWVQYEDMCFLNNFVNIMINGCLHQRSYIGILVHFIVRRQFGQWQVNGRTDLAHYVDWSIWIGR